MNSDPRLSIGSQLAQAKVEHVIMALDQLRPVIRVGRGLNPAAATAIGGLYSMLVRVHPHTVIEGDAKLGPNPWGATRLADLPELLAGCRPVPSFDPVRDLFIGAGSDVVDANLWFGGDDWTTSVDGSPVPMHPREHAFGIHAAAALVAGEVMKTALGPLGMISVAMSGPTVWNLLDYRLTSAPIVDLAGIQPPEVVIFGAGSVGSSVAGLLACDPRVAGTATVVDPDHFDPIRNIYRYPASTGVENGPKAAWVMELLARAGWTGSSLCGNVGNWSRLQPLPGWSGMVVSSVDNVGGRMDVADVLARTTISVGISGLALHTQLEHCFDEFACPYCDFANEASPMTQIQVRAQQVGLPPARVAKLHLNGAFLEAADVATAVAAGRIRAEQADELIGRRLDDLVRRVYAEATVPIAGEELATVSAPYVSWMAGLLAASEVVKNAQGLPLLDRRIDIDLGGMPLGVQSRRARNRSGNCVCSSPKRKTWAASLYGQDG